MKSRAIGILVMVVIAAAAILCMVGFKGSPRKCILEICRARPCRTEARGMTSAMAIL